jgi:two-component system, OmpR family, sensor histidine kinase CiaH
MADANKKLRRATIFFWILLLYIVAALVWWFVSLERQNAAMYELKKEEITNSAFDKNSLQFKTALAAVEDQQRRNTIKYISEGAIFLLIIIIGAILMYRLVLRQFQVQHQQQNFMMAITHELKTPISVARLNLETLQRHALNEEKQKKLIQSSLQETMRLDTLINNILVLSQIDAGSYPSSKEELDFSDLVSDVLHQFKNRYPDRKLFTEIEQDVDVDADPILLKLLVSNLLENANKYSEKCTAITCKLTKTNGIKLQVKDEGAGISEEEKKNIFQKFYRIGNEQTRKTQGTGLGLYLCKKIAAYHQADIYVTDNQPQGSIFTVQF